MSSPSGIQVCVGQCKTDRWQNVRGRRWNSGDLLRRTPGPFFYGCHEGHVRPHKLYKNHGQVQAQLEESSFHWPRGKKRMPLLFLRKGQSAQCSRSNVVSFKKKLWFPHITCNRSSRSPDRSLNFQYSYVGVIWFLFLVLRFLLIGSDRIRSMCSSLCWIDEFTMKRQQTSYRKPDLPWFSYGYWKCAFVDLFSLYESITCPPPPNPSLYCWRMRVLFGLFFLLPTFC